MIIDEVRRAAGCRVLFLPHAVRQMSRPDRMISADEVSEVVRTGVVLEDYPDDPRGHSCLVAAQSSEGRMVHVVCAPKADFLAVITAYVPDPEQWVDGTRRR